MLSLLVIAMQLNSSNEWSTPLPIPNTQSLTDFNACCNSNGDPIVVWSDDKGNIYGSIFQLCTWKNPDLIATNAANPKISCDNDGNAIIVWQANESNFPIFATGYRPNNLQYPITAPQQISTGPVNLGTNTFDLTFNNAGGYAVIAWQQFNAPDHGFIYSAKYIPEQTPFIFSLFDQAGPVPPSNPHVTCDGQNHALIVFQLTDTIHLTDSINLISYNPSSGSIDNIQTLDECNPNIDHVQICSDAPGHAIITYQCYDLITHLSIAFGGGYSQGIFTGPTQLSPTPTQPNFLVNPRQCCSQPGSALVVWQYNNTIYGTRFIPGFTPIVNRISDLNITAQIPQICCSDNSAHVLWLQGNNPYDIYSAFYTPNTPTNPVKITVNPFSSSIIPLLEIICCTNRTFALWQDQSLMYSFSPTEGPLCLALQVNSRDCATGIESITAFTSGGSGQYNYFVNDYFHGTSFVDVLLDPGQYVIKVEDALNPSIFTEKPLFVAAPLSLDIKLTDYDCFTGTETYTVTINGGNPPYYWRLSDEPNYKLVSGNQFVFDLKANTPPPGIGVQVRDSSKPDFCTITSDKIQAPAVFTASVTEIATTCYGKEVRLQAEGGHAPYFYELHYPHDDWQYFSGDITLLLSPGDYSIYFKDSSMDQAGLPCKFGPFPISVAEFKITSVTLLERVCDYFNKVQVNVEGGTPPYTYFLDSQKQEGDTFNIYVPFDGNIDVIDSNQCIATFPYSIQDLSMNIAVQERNCDTGQQTIQVNATGGIAPYIYLLNGQQQPTNVFQLIPNPTAYAIKVTDNKGADPSLQCSIQQNYNVPEPLKMQIVFKFNDPNTGNPIIQVIVTGGYLYYTYYMDGQEQAGDTFMVPEGMHVISVKDGGIPSCIVSQYYDSIPCGLQVNFEVKSTNCSTGLELIDVHVSGASHYTIYVDGVKIGEDLEAFTLTPGTHEIKFVDKDEPDNPCFYSLTVPEVLNLTITEGTRTCTTTTLIAHVTGGNPPFKYSLDGSTPPQDSNIFTDVPIPSEPQTHTITVFDNSRPNSCFTSAQYTVNPTLTMVFERDRFISTCDFTNVTVHTFGGKAPYTYFLNGAPQTGSTFQVPIGTHLISVKDSETPVPCTASRSITIVRPRAPSTSCLASNRLYLLDSFNNGAPIQSVAWSCSSEYCPTTLAATGGYKGCSGNCECASVRVFALDSHPERLTPIWSGTPTDYVYAVQWCCIDGVSYLAVAGCPDKDGNNLWIYRYDTQYNTMVLVGTSSAHNGIIYSIAWMCDECTEFSGVRNLVIGGQSNNNTEMQILQFNAIAGSITPINAISFGATVYAVDVCKDQDPCSKQNCIYLIAGGKTAYDCQNPVNLRLYMITCDGIATLITSDYFEGGTVRSLQWCCQADKICPDFMYLAVGGDPITFGPKAGVDIQIYFYHPTSQTFKPFAWESQPEKVFTVNWLPSCQCTHLAAGSGCLEQDCVQNIFVYGLNKLLVPRLATTTSKHFDDNVTSLAFCKIGDTYYALAGSESNNWKSGLDPLCPLSTSSKNQLALYKGMFCLSAILNC